jgi:hypothetical protein
LIPPHLYVALSDDGQITRCEAEPFDGAVTYKLERVPPSVWMVRSEVG